uniref:MARVEL domain-containing protein n=1 Tax=Parascaris univalens TaxID=6257 RepID=A0A915BXW9_PARUN
MFTPLTAKVGGFKLIIRGFHCFQVLRLAVWGAYIVYYIVLIIQNKSQGNGGDITVASIVVPGAPSVGLGNAGGKPMSS